MSIWPLTEPSTGFKTIIVPGDTDLSWLSDYGVKVTTKTAFEVNHLAGSETQCTRFHILEAIQKLLAQGANVTQAAIS